jgi:hypothetical protein
MTSRTVAADASVSDSGVALAREMGHALTTGMGTALAIGMGVDLKKSQYAALYL